MLFKHAGFAAVVVLAAGTSCLFSTTRPQPSPIGEEPVDPNRVAITGLVQFFDRTDHHIRNMPGWTVSVAWLVADRTGDGQPDVLYRTLVQSGSGGTYSATYNAANLVAAEVKALRCDYDPDAIECCLDWPPSCDASVCNIWTAPRRLEVQPGARVQQNITVPCDHVP